MKFPKELSETKDVGNGITVDEYSSTPHDFPIDGAVVHYRDGQYPWKKNKEFYELLFVLSGNLTVDLEYEKHILSKGDMFVIKPDVKHTTYAKDADVFVVCNPPFDLSKMDFC